MKRSMRYVVIALCFVLMLTAGSFADYGNHSFQTAKEIAANTPVNDLRSSEHEKNYYKMEVSENGYVSLEFRNTEASQSREDVRWSITVYDSDFNLMSTTAFEASTAVQESNKLAVSKGVYYFEVDSGVFSEAPYQLQVTFVASSFWEHESNDIPDNSNLIQLGTPYYGSLMNESDQDWYAFALEHPTTIQIQLETENTGDGTDDVTWKIDVFYNNANPPRTEEGFPIRLVKTGSKYTAEVELDPGNYGCAYYYRPVPSSWTGETYRFTVREKPDADSFQDVSPSAYYYEPVRWAVTHNPQITNGTSKTEFSPDAACTRGQVVTFLWRASGCPEPVNRTNPFSDVKTSDYYYNAVLWASEQGITAGTSATTFSPNTPCTRAHVVTFLWRAENQPAAGGRNPFSDVSAGQYYTDAVLWAVSRNITAGTDASHFSPANPCTRGQIVALLYRDMAS